MPHSARAAAHLEPQPVTDILSRFVVTHPSKGRGDNVEHEARRTFLSRITSHTCDFDDTHLKNIILGADRAARLVEGWSDIAFRTDIRAIAAR